MAISEWMAAGCLATLLATYAAYPLALLLWPRRRRATGTVGEAPAPDDVAVLIAAHNPPAEFGDSWSHFPTAVEVLVYDDVSDPPVTPPRGRPDAVVVAGTERAGKNVGLNRLLARVTRPILVFTDDSTEWRAGALEALIAPFADPGVGCTVGRLTIGGSRDERTYWCYEEWIKAREARAGELIGAIGCVFAMRRELLGDGFTPGMNNDFEAALLTLAQRRAVVLAPEAHVVEPAVSASGSQWRRKVRIVSRAVATMRRYVWRLPWRIVARLVGHKLVRYLATVWQVGLLAASIAGAVESIGWLQGLLAAQAAGYALALAGLVFGRRAGRLATLAAYVNVTNAAAFVGLLRGLLGRPVDVWNPTAQLAADDGE